MRLSAGESAGSSVKLRGKLVVGLEVVLLAFLRRLLPRRLAIHGRTVTLRRRYLSADTPSLLMHVIQRRAQAMYAGDQRGWVVGLQHPSRNSPER